jgi:enamine deaminase RidA (YjgF/YER057c/UK114 family)
MSAEARLRELGIELPPVPPPMGTYVRAVRAGNLLFLAGHGPRKDDKHVYVGKVGRDFTVEEAAQAARLVGLGLLASTRAALGSLDRVKRVVKVLGMVNAVDGFGDQPKVINGCSDLLVEVFGEAGRHARSAVGMGSLPAGIAVEIEMIIEVVDDQAPAPPRRAVGRSETAGMPDPRGARRSSAQPARRRGAGSGRASARRAHTTRRRPKGRR